MNISLPYGLSNRLTLEDLMKHLINSEELTTDYLISLLKIHKNTVHNYEILLIKDYDKTAKMPVSAVHFHDELIGDRIIPVIGNKGLHIIDINSLNMISAPPRPLDYSVNMDSNIVSKAEKYFLNKIDTFDENFKYIEDKNITYDLTPYIIEQFINGYENHGKTFKLNKKDKSQAGIFRCIRTVHKNLNFEIDNTNQYVNWLSKAINDMSSDLIRYYNYNKITLIYILHSRLLFPSKDKIKKPHIVKRKKYILESLTNSGIPFSNRLLKLITIFFDNDNYDFFNKVRSYNKKTKEENYRANLSNTARDMLICTMPSILDNSKIFPILYTDDKGLATAYKDIQADFIFHIDTKETKYHEFGRTHHIYVDINKEYGNNEVYKEFFTEESKEKRYTKNRDINYLFNREVKTAEKELLNALQEQLEV